jgi:DNA repair protein RadC
MKTYKSTTPEIGLKKIPSNYQKAKITSSEESAEYIRQFYGDDLEIYESFFLLMLDRANRTIGWVKISQGGIAATYVDPMIIAKYCVEHMASSFVLGHNHPSGQRYPSEADKTITKQIKEGLKLLGCKLMDHIILTADSYYSFADEGMV